MPGTEVKALVEIYGSACQGMLSRQTKSRHLLSSYEEDVNNIPLRGRNQISVGVTQSGPQHIAVNVGGFDEYKCIWRRFIMPE